MYKRSPVLQSSAGGDEDEGTSDQPVDPHGNRVGRKRGRQSTAQSLADPPVQVGRQGGQSSDGRTIPTSAMGVSDRQTQAQRRVAPGMHEAHATPEVAATHEVAATLRTLGTDNAAHVRRGERPGIRVPLRDGGDDFALVLAGPNDLRALRLAVGSHRSGHRESSEQPHEAIRTLVRSLPRHAYTHAFYAMEVSNTEHGSLGRLLKAQARRNRGVRNFEPMSYNKHMNPSRMPVLSVKFGEAEPLMRFDPRS